MTGTRGTPEVRLLRSLTRSPANGCLEWSGVTNRRGYGRLQVQGRMVLTHRLAWELANGSIPEGMNVLHRCDNPPCCDPEHLFLGTQKDNVADMIAKGRKVHGQRAKTHCPRNHPYDEQNTYITAKGWRSCIQCARERGRDRSSS